MGHLAASQPLELLAIDFTLLEPSKHGCENVLDMTDVLTKFLYAVATMDQKATTVAKVLVKEWFQRYGTPRRIHSDQGRNFEVKLSRNCAASMVCRGRTTPYHPEGSIQSERYNRKLHDLLRTLPPGTKK